jgi:hypothetical protein
MNISLVVVSYNKPEMTETCVESAVTTGVREGDSLTVFLFNHYHPAVGYMEDMKDYYPEVVLHNFGVNRGLARSWNDGIAEARLRSEVNEYASDHAIIVANADIEFREDSLSLFARAIQEQGEERAIVWCNGEHSDAGKGHSMGYSLFGVTPLGIREVGYFDQNFFPAYAEDCDYDRRIKLLGLPAGHCGFGSRDDAVYHVGSAHIRQARGVDANLIVQQTTLCHEKNVDYFARKWGYRLGEDETKGFPTPFNDPSLPLRISWGRKDHPYGEHDRKDQGIVVV